MARKRKSSEMEPPRESMPAPEGGIGHEPNGKELDEQFAQFCRDAHLSPPRSTPHTRRTEDIQKLYNRLEQLYRFLYWRNRPQLQQEEYNFFRSVLSTPNEKLKLEAINERLENVRTTTPHRGTPKHSVSTKPLPASSLPTVDEFARPDPPSPTRTRKAANIETSSQTAAPIKSTAKALPAGPSSSRHAQLPPIKSHFAVTKQALLKAKPAPIDTSFATDASRSFGGPPIFSQSTQSGTQLTAATELSSDDEHYYSAKQTVSGGKVGSNQTTDSEEDMKRESTQYYSSLAPSEARSLIAAAQRLESSQETVRKIPRTSHATSTSPRGSQLWGSSIDTSQADFLQARADMLLEDPDACITDQPSYTFSGRADSPKRARLDQNRQLITPSDDEVEQQAVLPPLTEMTPHRFLPADGFAQFKIPESFAELSFELQWEAQRVLQAEILQPEQLEQQWHPRNLETLYRLVSVSAKPFRQGFNADQSTSWEKVTLNAKLEYAKSRSGSLFDVILQSPNRGDDCALQRKFGNQNVLYVEIPNLNKPPVELKGKNLCKRFHDMALHFQHFLGRKWFLYLTQAHKRKKKVDPEATKAGTCRLMFIAVDKGFTMTDVLLYVIPYKDNSRQAARKLYSRFELAASSTTPVFTFAREDVQIVEDQLASTDAADKTFLDPALASQFYEPQVSDRVMNDGCCEIHPWVMWQATFALGGTELKTALQARFGLGMAKGIWYRGPDASSASLDVRPPGPLIRISRSQIKVKHSSLRDLDWHGLTLNVVKANSDVRPSILHVGFLPILVDRGVPKQDLIELVREQIQNDMDELEVALKNPSPMPLRHWMHRRHELWEERNRTGGISTVAGFPIAREERIVQMLESGLVPSQEAFLASEVRTMVKMVLDTKKKNFKIPLSRSTTLLGAALADPLNCLAPGEIHVNFARPFHDKVTGMAWPILHELECLIARNPAMAPWDMQKVKAVFKPELAHLPNMVILSAKGKRPLAELLQGGDYDGDTFWLCWEPRLVQPFRNHPAPWDPPSIEFFGIKKDPKLLCDYVKQPSSDSQWLKWLADMAETRMGFNLLGVVTKLHERLIYLEGGIRSKKALYLVHLHDYLVDADKQGYDFTTSDLEAFKQRIKLPTNLPTPAHWEFTKVDTNDDEDVYPVHDFKIKGNIIDDVFLKVVHPMAQASLSRVHDILRPAAELQDLRLAKFYNETLISAANDDDMATSAGHILAPREARDLIREELKALGVGLGEVREFWATQQKRYTFNELLLQLRVKYESIMPTHTYHPTVVEWLRRQGNDLTIWEKLRASAFARFQYNTGTRGKLVWHVAGRELCLLKAHECPQTRTLTMEAWSSLRPRKELKTVDVDEDENTPEIIEDNDEDGVLNEYY
ncbi:RNA-dependent RNA polymerase 1 [Pseudocercospora fuligena]|uniref:RNA-dependent RNA polymerase n=1 Tax=Pseudocercospora fuligena TaxID=685502 RepID=A0A8H6VJS4_9PEZI|nr:RNA-dependent RNA polymerase 1 [Pseudocercospora fuligena]